MKKTLIALAALAAAGAASAQSSVTLFGIIDASVSRYLVQNGGGYNTVMTNSGYNSSRLGFRGTEDLGGGMSASFWLEGQLQNDVGYGANQVISGNNSTGLDFRRRSTVSLAGSSWGELRLGRDYTPTFWNLTIFDPYGTVGVGSNLVHKWKLYASNFATAPATGLNGVAGGVNAGGVATFDPNYVRAPNMIGYFLPANLGDFYGQVNFAFDEVAGRSKQGRYWGGRVGYGSGPFNVALAYGHTDGGLTLGLTSAAAPRVNNWNLGGQWDFGMARLMGTYDRAKYEGGTAGDLTLKSWMIGTIVPVGAGEIKASYARTTLDTTGADPKTNQLAIGYVHNLSKRTALYTTYARVHNSNGAMLPVNASLSQGPSNAASGNSGINGVPNAGSWGFDLGIRHAF